ncbi:MAG: tyrosine recombinase XerC, partial [Actinobacteria bacterium]|nr:tyrosine recombinase XerC [Actinomycetota bacterium]
MGSQEEALSPGWQAAIEEFVLHLRQERGRSEHTIRAYESDITTVAQFACSVGVDQPRETDIEVLRAWLMDTVGRGLARSSIARKVATLRTFSQWAARVGLFATDVAARLAAPKVPS